MTSTTFEPSTHAQTLASWGLEKSFPKPHEEAWKHMGLEAIVRPAWYPVREEVRVAAPLGAPIELLRRNRSTGLAESNARKHRPTALADLNAAFFSQALTVRVPQSVCSLQPLRLEPTVAANPVGTHPAEADGWMIHPRARVVLEPGSRLDVIWDSSKLGAPTASGLVNAVLDIELEEHTALNLVIVGPNAPNVVSLLDVAVTQGRDSVFRAFCFEDRPHVSRLDLFVSLDGENASTDLFGLALLAETSKAYHHLNVHHRVPHTQSQQVFKSVLGDASRFEYDSLVTIHPEAPQSSSEQLNKNLVLSDDARAFARPQLAIHTDDVQCHHGATVGQTNPEEMFYLRTRGIDPASAAELVLRGFVEDLLKEVPIAVVAKELEERSRRRLTEISR